MHVTHLSLTDFRSYEVVDLTFDPGVTALVGPNGQGKTNLVEAIGYVATLGSHRVATDAPLVRQGAAARGGAVRHRPGRAHDARRAGDRARAAQPRPAQPLAAVAAARGARRRCAPCCSRPRTSRWSRATRTAGAGSSTTCSSRARRGSPASASDYERVLRQRNALLKTAGSTIKAGRGDVRTLDVWDTHLATAGAELLAGRLRLVRELAPAVAAAYEAISDGQGDAGVGYRSTLGDDVTADAPADRELLQARLLEAMARSRAAELERGVSLVGPHRDDLVLTLGELPARGYASHGESWSFALALRLASYDLLRADGGARGRAGADPGRRLRRARRPPPRAAGRARRPTPSRCS